MNHLQRNSKTVHIQKHFMKPLHKSLHITKVRRVSKAKVEELTSFISHSSESFFPPLKQLHMGRSSLFTGGIKG